MSALQMQAHEMINQMSEENLNLIVELMKKIKASVEISSEKENGIKYGIAKGKFTVPDDIDECNDEIAEMFGVLG